MNENSVGDDLRRAMRSFHRLIELKRMNSPEVLVAKELELLARHFRILSADELVFMMKVFSDYHDAERAEDALTTEKFFEESLKYFGSLN